MNIFQNFILFLSVFVVCNEFFYVTCNSSLLILYGCRILISECLGSYLIQIKISLLLAGYVLNNRYTCERLRAVEGMRMYAILNSTLAYELDSDGRVTGGIRSTIFNLVKLFICVILRTTKLNFY